MKSTIVNHNTSTVAVLDKWVTVNSATNEIVGTYSNRQLARDSKTGKVYSLNEVTVVKKEVKEYLHKSTIEKPCSVAYDLVSELYGKMKPKEIYKIAGEKGIAYITARDMYKRYRENNGITRHNS